MKMKLALCASLVVVLAPLGALAREAVQTDEVQIWHEALRAPKVVTNTSSGLIIAESGSSAPVWLDNLEKHQFNQPVDNDPANSTAIVNSASLPNGIIPLEWLMVTEEDGFWGGTEESPSLGRKGTCTVYRINIVLPEGDTTTGADFNAGFKYVTSKGANQNPLQGRGANRWNRWITGPGDDDVLFTADDDFTTDPDEPIVAAFGHYQACFLIGDDFTEQWAGTDEVQDQAAYLANWLMQNPKFYVRTSMTLITSEGESVNSMKQFNYGLASPDVCVEFNETEDTWQVIINNTSGLYLFCPQWSEDLEDWTSFPELYIGNGGTVVALSPVEGFTRLFYRVKYDLVPPAIP